MKTYYKVVVKTENPEIFKSAFDKYLGKYSLQYQLGKTTNTDNFIFIFGNFDSAKAFLYTNKMKLGLDQKWNPAVFEGTATKVRKIKYCSFISPSTPTSGAIEYFHKRRTFLVRIKRCNMVPTGTLVCSSFTPTHLISGKDWLTKL